MSIQKWTVMREQVGASYVIMDLYETEKKKKGFKAITLEQVLNQHHSQGCRLNTHSKYLIG